MFLALRKSPKKPKRVKRSPKRSPKRNKSNHKKSRRGSNSDSGGGGGGGGSFSSAPSAPITAAQFIAAPNQCSQRVAELELQLRECQTKLSQQSGAIIPVAPISNALVTQAQPGPIVPSNSIPAPPQPPAVKPFDTPPVFLLPAPPAPPAPKAPSPPPPPAPKAPPAPKVAPETPSSQIVPVKPKPTTALTLMDQLKMPKELKKVTKTAKVNNNKGNELTNALQNALQQRNKVLNESSNDDDDNVNNEIDELKTSISKIQTTINELTQKIQDLSNQPNTDPLDGKLNELEKDFNVDKKNNLEFVISSQKLKLDLLKNHSKLNSNQIVEIEKQIDNLEGDAEKAQLKMDESGKSFRSLRQIVIDYKTLLNSYFDANQDIAKGKEDQGNRKRENLDKQKIELETRINSFIPGFTIAPPDAPLPQKQAQAKNISKPPLPPRKKPEPAPKQTERTAKLNAKSKIHTLFNK
jgi:uncharacterized coiled-coil DUF342 family protein